MLSSLILVRAQRVCVILTSVTSACMITPMLNKTLSYSIFHPFLPLPHSLSPYLNKDTTGSYAEMHIKYIRRDSRGRCSGRTCSHSQQACSATVCTLSMRSSGRSTYWTARRPPRYTFLPLLSCNVVYNSLVSHLTPTCRKASLSNFQKCCLTVLDALQ